MLQSVKVLHDDLDLFFILADELADVDTYTKHHDGYVTLKANEIGISDYYEMAFVYDQVELNTAVKPFVFKYLIANGYDKILYLDPDILVLDRLDVALDILEDHSAVLTPHQLLPVTEMNCYNPDFKWEFAALQTGIFNLGFIGISSSPEGCALVDWWCNRCRYTCVVEPNLFVDQLWINLAVSYFPSIHILRHEGYNMAVWNIHARVLHKDSDTILVNGKYPLVFFHFSSLYTDDVELISRHDPLLTLSSRADLVPLFKLYRGLIQKNGYNHYIGIPYAYSRFRDGAAIQAIERKFYISIVDTCNNPFELSQKEFYEILSRNCRLGLLPIRGLNDGLVRFIAKMIFKGIFALVGAKYYSKMVMQLRGIDSISNHTFIYGK